MASAELERRINETETSVEYRDVGGGEKRPVIVGMASVFDSESRDLGGFVETVNRQAFNNVLATNPDVVGVLNHDKNVLLSRVSNGTLRLMVTERGLRYEMIPPNTTAARDAVELVEGGYITGSSFAFAVKRGGDSWSTDSSGRRRREIREIALLDDVGPVVRPAYGASSVVVSRRAIEMALGDAFRPNQTMANAARRGLRAAKSRDDYDQRLLAIAERIVERDVLSVEEVEFLAAAHAKCHEVRSVGWSGTQPWVEWMLAGGDAGEKWSHRRSQKPVQTIAPAGGDAAEESRAAPNELKEGDFASWSGGIGRVEHIMREGSIQGMTASADAPLAVLTPYDDGRPEGHMVAVKVSELTKTTEPTPGPDDVDDGEDRAVSLRPTAGMAASARRGLRLHEEGKSGDGLKPETVARAGKISRREELTADHVREMNAWFARHETASKSPGWNTPGAEKPGYVAWELWGGDAAQVWSARKVAQMERESERSEEPAPESAVATLEPEAAEATPAVVPQETVPEQTTQSDPILESMLKLADLQDALLRTKLHDMKVS